MKMQSVTSPIATLSLNRTETSQWQRWLNGNLIRMMAWFGFQVALGLACRLAAVAATAHAVLTIVVSLWMALVARKREYAIYSMAYIVGSEVLWRMANAGVFWEYGKYAVLAVAVTALVRHQMFQHAGLPLTYFTLLLPSIIMPLANLGDIALQQTISFYLSGPLALAMCYWLCSNFKLTQEQVLRGSLFLLGPIISIASFALFSLTRADNIFFGASSNHAASGGYGPNQVSSAFGLGIVTTLLYAVLEKRERWLKALLGLIVIWFSAQCVLTFSRTGIYLAGASALSGALFLLRERRARLTLLLAALLIGGGLFIMLPALENFTQGALSKRFSNLNTTGRDTLAWQELEIWGDNLFFGVGPGMSGQYRTGELSGVMAHTEYTRLLSEHGLFGLVAMALMLVLAIQNLRQARSPGQRAFVIALLSWAILFMFTSAMRTAAPAFLFGLTAIQWRDEITTA